MTRMGFVFAALPWIAAGCGESVRHDAAPVGPDAVIGDGPLDGAAWIAVRSDHDIRLVSLDDPSAPMSKVLASSEFGFTGAFGPNGDRFAFATRADASTPVVTAVAAPAGSALGDPWMFEGRASELAWVGDTWLVAGTDTPGASGALLQLGAPDAVAALPPATGAFASTGQTLAARLADDRLMVVDALDGPQWTAAVPGDWQASLAGNGLGLAIVGPTPWPTPGLSISTTLVPTAGSLDHAGVSWPTPDEPMLLELTRSSAASSSELELVVINTAAPPAPLPFDPLYEETGPCWVRLPDESVVLLEAADDGTPWSIDVAALAPTAPDHLVLERSGVTGFRGFPDFAILSGDASVVFADTYDDVTATSTVATFAVPVGPESTVTPLFETAGDVKIMTPAPRGSGLVIGANASGQPFGTACDDAATGCESGRYFLTDGVHPAVPLPDGFYGAVWTPDGGGLIGRQGDYVVYVAAGEPAVPHRLARGNGFYVPPRW